MFRYLKIVSPYQIVQKRIICSYIFCHGKFEPFDSAIRHNYNLTFVTINIKKYCISKGLKFLLLVQEVVIKYKKAFVKSRLITFLRLYPSN